MGNSDDEEKECFTPRRGQRQKKLSLKALESFHVEKLINGVSTDDRNRKDSFTIDEDIEKPTILHNSESVHGEQIFKFHSRKARNSILQKAAEVRNQPQTPHTARSNFKNSIKKKLTEESKSDCDFSDSGSEYSVSESSESQESEEESDSQIKSNVPKVGNLTRKSQRVVCRNKYVIKTEDYFANNSSKKIITSNHTLDKLETPRLPQNLLHKLLKKTKLSVEHKSAICKLDKVNQSNFSKWLYFLHENFNILLYGLGSKREILNDFQEEYLKDLPVIVINGFFPSLTIKDVLDGIVVDLLEKENSTNVYEVCDLIEEEFHLIPDIHLYIIIHNIDMIRVGKAQNVLARLASIENIHLIASIDHINAPLIWNHSKLGKFNFTWWDVTSFQNYVDETSFECSMMIQQTGVLALSSLRNVFLSLTNNSKGIYLILVKHQLKNETNHEYQGLSFKELYSMCREAFLVSSDLALRTQLTEFVDHKMVKFKRIADGTENLLIPITNRLLHQFLNEQQTE